MIRVESLDKQATDLVAPHGQVAVLERPGEGLDGETELAGLLARLAEDGRHLDRKPP